MFFDAEFGEELVAEFGKVGVAAVAGAGAGGVDNALDSCGGVFVVFAEDDDAVGEVEGFFNVVGDEKDSSGVLGVDVEEEVLHFNASEGIEGAEGFVEEEDAGGAGEGSGEGGSLCHAAGDFAGAVVAVGGEPDEVEEGVDCFLAFCGGGAFGEADGDIFFDGAPGEEAGFLEADCDAGIEAVDGVAVNADGAGGGGAEACGGTEEGGFAAAGGADDGDNFAGGCGEGDVVQDGAFAVFFGEGFADLFEADVAGAGGEGSAY